VKQHTETICAKATVHEAVKAMNQHGVRHLFITEPNGRLMGLLSLDDLKFAAE
jgi:CBS domain-containing protein